jgi:hypothetical protein
MRIPLRKKSSYLYARSFWEERNHTYKERRQWRLSLSNYVDLALEIAAAFRVAAVAIQFNRLARSFARCTAVFATWLRRTSTWWVLALILFVIVCHRNSLLPDLSVLVGLE